MIAAGRVTVNGITAGLGDSAEEDDIVCVDGRKLSIAEERCYIILNKPRGYITTLSDERGRPTVAQLVEDVGVRLYPVGRLDFESEGLLILTDDGEAANALMHPSKEIPKTYLVKVKGTGFSEAAEKLRHPLTDTDGTRFQGGEVNILRSSGDVATFSVTIREGKNREIRRMCALCGLRVLRLRRIQQGEIKLGDLPPGKWRRLTQEEVAFLHSISKTEISFPEK